MINKGIWLVGLCLLLAACNRTNTADLVASVGERTLSRADFATWAGVPFDSLSAEARQPLVNAWLELAMIEQEVEATGLRKDADVSRQERELLARFHRAVLLARLPEPKITDSLIADYYTTNLAEFRRPMDSYLIEGFWCESDDTLKAFRRALERADTSQLRSDMVIWEGKWLTDSRELDPILLEAVRKLPAGGMTPVLPFGEGYRLLRLHELYPEGAQLSLDAVRQEIRERLLTEQSQRRQERWETELRGRYQPRLMGDTK